MSGGKVKHKVKGGRERKADREEKKKKKYETREIYLRRFSEELFEWLSA